MQTWRERLKHDPVKPLTSCAYTAIRYYAGHDLLGEDVEPIQTLWSQPEAKKLLRNQRGDGSWAYPGKDPEKYPDVKYSLLETFKRLRGIVGKYELDKSHPAVEAAAEYVFTCQTPEGDFRGIYVDQYSPHYTGVIIELLVKAGYGGDPRVEDAIRWLIRVKQRDGGWAYPGLTAGLNWEEGARITSQHAETLPFDPSKPFSHSVTGMALRGLACHPKYAHSPDAAKAGELLASRFFKPDTYNSFRAADYWLRFQYPFWWNNLVMALNSLQKIGFKEDHPRVAEALDWLIEHQSGDGLWDYSYRKESRKIDTEKARDERRWVTLAICRVFEGFERNG
jgi:hypothetical protein